MMVSLIPGQLAKVDSEDRLCIPRDLLNAVTWWTNERVKVTAELTERGLVRVYLANAVAQTFQYNEQPESEKAFVTRAVAADRYRELSLYKDGRLRMTKELCPWLDYHLGEQPELYVQPFPRGLEVMTMNYRFARLALRSKDILPWTFERP